MVLPTTGNPISFSQIQTEMGGVNPISMSEYYGNASPGYCIGTSGQNLPNIGSSISYSQFIGKFKPSAGSSLIDTNSWYSYFTKIDSAFTMVQSGSDPDVQLQMNSLGTSLSRTGLYSSAVRIQDYASFTIDFMVYIPTTCVADGLCFYVGETAYQTLENPTAGGFAVNFQVYSGYTARAIYLVNGSGTRVASSVIDIRNNNWIPVKIIYTRGISDTWKVYYNGILNITYSDTSNASWLTTSGAYWGFGCRTGGASGDFFIKNVSLSYTTMAIDQGASSIWPWNSAFADTNARWIWDSVNSPGGALPGYNITFRITYNNTTGSSMTTTLSSCCDNILNLYLNGTLIWSPVFPNWNGLSTTVTLIPGLNIFDFVGRNAGATNNAAGLIFSLKDSGNNVIMRSDNVNAPLANTTYTSVVSSVYVG
jgi:hypothetical protein